ncbi:MAG: helix-turn-helix domain-containing protein [Gemmatimonadales bacterium]
MIVVRCTDPLLRQAVALAARVEEDVITDADLSADALQWRFARLLVRAGGHLGGPTHDGTPALDLDDATLRRWEVERRSEATPQAKLDFLVERLRTAIEDAAIPVTWVDAALADLSRAAGSRLPLPLRSFARRVLEFPTRYTSLHPIADECALSRGALKARFRRRGLASPSVYLRWLRVMAAAQVLSDRAVTVSSAAHRLGFTSDGNLCRTMAVLAQITPTEVRTVRGWNRLLITFAWAHLTPAALDAWAQVGQLFQRRVA